MLSMSKALMEDMMGSFPGVDEAMSFAQVMRCAMGGWLRM